MIHSPEIRAAQEVLWGFSHVTAPSPHQNPKADALQQESSGFIFGRPGEFTRPFHFKGKIPRVLPPFGILEVSDHKPQTLKFNSGEAPSSDTYTSNPPYMHPRKGENESTNRKI